MIYQERLKIEIKLLLSANSKSYMPRRMAQQRMTLSDLGWPFHALCSIFAVAERLVGCSDSIFAVIVIVSLFIQYWVSRALCILRK